MLPLQVTKVLIRRDLQKRFYFQRKSLLLISVLTCDLSFIDGLFEVARTNGAKTFYQFGASHKLKSNPARNENYALLVNVVLAILLRLYYDVCHIVEIESFRKLALLV